MNIESLEKVYEKLLKEDENFLFFQGNGTFGATIPKHAYFEIHPERNKREDQDYWEATEYDGKRPYLFKVFPNEKSAKDWVNENPEIRECNKLILEAVL